jgi:hypothetical protein
LPAGKNIHALLCNSFHPYLPKDRIYSPPYRISVQSATAQPDRIINTLPDVKLFVSDTELRNVTDLMRLKIPLLGKIPPPPNRMPVRRFSEPSDDLH